MGCGSHNADFHRFFLPRFSGCKSTVFSTAVMTFHRITDIIAEHGHTFHLRHVLLQGTAFYRKRTVACRPAFTVNHGIRVDGAKFFGHTGHCFRIVNSHEVEAETVDVEFLHPVFHGVDNIVAHLLAVGSRFVATGRSVAVSAVGTMAVIIARSCKREIGIVGQCRMVVDHIHDYADTCIVKRQHHFLHFTDTSFGIHRIG